jgi:hypothetical protein
MRAEQSYFRVGELLLLTLAEINTLVGGPIDISSVCMTGAEFDGSRPPRTRGVRIAKSSEVRHPTWVRAA